MESTSRRTEILNAALACFAARGIDGATIADIRTRAGATTGSVYHFFDGKDAIVGALYLQLLREYHKDVLECLRRHGSARALIRGIVEQYLAWVERRPDAARFLLDARHTGAIETADDEIAAANAIVFGELRARLKPWVDGGELRKLPMDVFFAILVGPAETFTRRWLAERSSSSLARARALLATAAWDSLRGDGDR